MNRSGWMKVFVLLWLLIGVCFGRELKAELPKYNDLPAYNHTFAKILVEYNAAVYESDLTELFTWTCSRCNDFTTGFEVVELIVDVEHCLQAYVGVAENLNAIVIAFRGTQEHSIQNWIEDLYWQELDLNYPDMPDALVHHGFYYAYHNTTLRPGVINGVKQAKELFGDLKIIILGHSMGGALASFCALDLRVHHGMENIQVMTFGQPRIGNAAFASYYIQYVPDTIRVTHEHDIVPHLPPYYPHLHLQRTYHHFPREVWLHKTRFGTFEDKVCDESGEDPSCSRSVMGSSILDHLCYYDVNLKAESWNSCRIVRDPSLAKYGKTDDAGNIILSKKPMSPVTRLNPDTNAGVDVV